MLDLARNVVHVLDPLGIDRCHLFGLHTGAGVAAKAAAEWPARFRSLMLFGFPLIEDQSERDAYFATYHNSSLPISVSPDGSHMTALWMRAYSEIVRLWLHTAGAPSDTLWPHPLQAAHTFMSDQGPGQAGHHFSFRL